MELDNDRLYSTTQHHIEYYNDRLQSIPQHHMKLITLNHLINFQKALSKHHSFNIALVKQ